MCYISFVGLLYASFKLVITRATAYLSVTCVLRIHDVSASNELSFKNYSFIASVDVTTLHNCNSMKRSIPVFLSITWLAILSTIIRDVLSLL